MQPSGAQTLNLMLATRVQPETGLMLYAVELTVPHPVTAQPVTVHTHEPLSYAAFREAQLASCAPVERA